MYHPEIVPQSMVDTKTIVFKPRLDQDDVQLIGQILKRRLFSRFGLKPKLEDVRLLSCETYFEPYLIIGGRYALDYCKKHVFNVDVDEKTTKVLVGGQEFRSERIDVDGASRVVKVKGEEHAHHERQTYFVLDRMKREIQPEKLPISPFGTKESNFDPNPNFRSIQISDEAQLEFLKTRIAKRPANVAEIIREIFEITERTIVYYPMYQLTFENTKSKKDAIITINGITGEIVLNGTKKLATKIVVAATKTAVALSESEHRSAEMTTLQARTEAAFNVGHSDIADSTKSAPEQRELTLATRAKRDRSTAVTGDVEIPSGSTIDKDLQVEGTLRIGDGCKIRGRLEATKDVTIGVHTIINGDLVSGGNVTIGSHSLISGSLQTAAYVKMGECATIEGGLRSHRAVETTSRIRLEVVEVEEFR